MVHSMPSDSPIHTHGLDPLSSWVLYALWLSAYGRRSINSLDTTADTRNWILKLVRSIRYEAAAKASLGSSALSANFPSAWNDIWVRQILPSLAPVMLPMPNQARANEPMGCGVCKIDCSSTHFFEKRVSGKKQHKNMHLLNTPTNAIIPGASHASLQSQTSIGGQDLFGVVSKELESKKQKLVKGGAAVDSVRVCTICSVACNSQDVYNKHLCGKKHAAQISLMSDNGNGPYLAASNHHSGGPWKKGPNKIKFTQPGWCELCKISCTSRDVYMTHLAGKKHLRNLELLSKPNNALQLATNPVIRPQEKPDTCKDEGPYSHEPNKAALVEDIEAKKLKLVEGGAAESDIRICTLCNVVCNSQKVFYFHLAGQKHAAMVKLKQELAGSSNWCSACIYRDSNFEGFEKMFYALRDKIPSTYLSCIMQNHLK